jgi:hypothetical protein
LQVVEIIDTKFVDSDSEIKLYKFDVNFRILLGFLCLVTSSQFSLFVQLQTRNSKMITSDFRKIWKEYDMTYLSGETRNDKTQPV